MYLISAPTRAQGVCHTFSNLGTKIHLFFELSKYFLLFFIKKLNFASKTKKFTQIFIPKILRCLRHCVLTREEISKTVDMSGTGL